MNGQPGSMPGSLQFWTVVLFLPVEEVECVECPPESFNSNHSKHPITGDAVSGAGTTHRNWGCNRPLSGLEVEAVSRPDGPVLKSILATLSSPCNAQPSSHNSSPGMISCVRRVRKVRYPFVCLDVVCIKPSKASGMNPMSAPVHCAKKSDRKVNKRKELSCVGRLKTGIDAKTTYLFP